MRFGEYMIGPMQSVLDRRANEIEGFLQFFAGGWEAWLQVELAMELWQLSNKNQEFQAQREVPYPAGNYRWDLRINPKKGTNLYVELKTQRSNLDPTSFKRFKEDFMKVNALSSTFRRENVTGVLAVSKLVESDEQEEYANFMRIHAYNVDRGSGTRVWQQQARAWIERRHPDELVGKTMTLICWTPVS